MDNWFDNFSKALALGAISRRSILKALVAVIANTLFARLVRRELVPVASADSLSGRSERPTAKCAPFDVHHIPGETTTNFCANKIYNGKLLTLRGSTSASGPLLHPRTKASTYQFESSISMFYAGDLLVSVSSWASSLVHRSKLLSERTIIQYGKAIPGAPRSILSVVNGKLTGTVANVPVMPRTFDLAAPRPNVSERLALADGHTVVPPKFEPGLASAMRELFTLANENIKRSRQRLVGSNVTHSKPSVFSRLGFIAEASNAPQTSQACGNCVNNCEEVTAACVALAAGTCVWDFGISCLALPACYTSDVICHDNCNSPGGACCPQTCPGNDMCCESGSLLCDCGCCYSDQSVCTNNGCCPKDRPVGCPAGDYIRCCPSSTDCCGETCCPPGFHCGDPAQHLCCPNGQDACGSTCCPTGNCQPGNICCPPGQQICNNLPGMVPARICCEGGACDNQGVCCNQFGALCNGVCCSGFGVNCCKGACCDGVCLSDRNGQIGCCPWARQPCGVGGDNPVCCPAGYQCVDPHEGICAPCPAGQTACMSTNETGPITSVCCPPGVNCCNGKCCAPSEICCKNIFEAPLVFGCHSGSLCIE
jgi:hypothetical protein